MKRWLCLLLTLCLVLPLVPMPAKAAPVYSASGSLEQPKPSKEEIYAAWKKMVRPDTKKVYEEEPVIKAPYAAGKLTQFNLDSGLSVLNYFRFVANVPEVTWNEAMNEAAQHGAVLLAATGVLTHYPNRPADMDDDFFYKGSSATSSSNLSAGTTSVADHVSGCIYDRGVNNLANVGHRRWLLSPTLKQVGFGLAGGFAATKVFMHGGETPDNHGTAPDYDFVSWPSSGYFPDHIFNKASSWSVSFNPEKYTIPSQEKLKVTLTRESDGTVWIFDKNTPGPESERKMYWNVSRSQYGDGGAIVFTPGSDNSDDYEGVFTVKVEGLEDPYGNRTSIAYQVEFFSLLDVCPHQWKEADCYQPKTCVKCGAKEGVAAGHQFPENVCASGTANCPACGLVIENVDGHRWYAASCDKPKYCAICGTTEGEPRGHNWQEATCTKPQTCASCGQKEGKTLGHKWEGGSCTAPATCARCQATQIVGHDYFAGVCDTCGGADPDYKEPVIPENPTAPGDPTIIRLAGKTRYKTAFAAADELKKIQGVEKFHTIIVSSGEQFADALAGSYLAAVKDAPILLVKDSTVKAVKEYIQANLNPGGTVYLLGGKAAVPEKMETGLENFVVNRLGGSDRYETNLKILREAGLNTLQVAVCTGKNFADSLSASALGVPILLVKDSLNSAQKGFLTQNTGKEFVIIGGKSAVSEKAEKELAGYGSVTRVAGNTRYETSVLVAKTFFEDPQAAVVAYGKNFPDGLSGGPVAYAIGAPLILTESGKEKTAAAYMAETGITSGYVLGGTTVLPEKTVNKVFGKN